jgi:glycosyltransferase involved in cell wall biosynthesis
LPRNDAQGEHQSLWPSPESGSRRTLELEAGLQFVKTNIQLMALKVAISDFARGMVFLHGAKLVSVVRHLLSIRRGSAIHLRLLMLEHRLSRSGSCTPAVKKHLRDILRCMPELMGQPERHISLTSGEFRALILKAPSCEGDRIFKGVLLVKFTETFRYLYHHIDIPSLLKYFHVVLEPSWSGYCVPEILFWTAHKEHVFVQASEELDRQFLCQINSNLVPMEFGASDWVDHRVFRPISTPKIYDAVYIANLSPIKRVHIFISAVARATRQRPGFRSALVLSSWGGRRGEFEQLLKHYGVGDQITVLMNQPQERLNEILNQSRVSVLLSRKEGSNKTLFESMFAGTPVLLLRGNIGVNKKYINDATGRIVDERDLVDALLAAADDQLPKHPREWAMKNISPEITTAKLQTVIARYDPHYSTAQTALTPKVNAPEAEYMHEADRRNMADVTRVLRCFLRGDTGADLHSKVRSCFAPRSPSV